MPGLRPLPRRSSVTAVALAFRYFCFGLTTGRASPMRLAVYFAGKIGLIYSKTNSLSGLIFLAGGTLRSDRAMSVKGSALVS
jgi:hypothetical protein